MPIYEYEPCDHDCLICEGKLQLLQKISDEALTRCPYCGLGIKKVVSQVTHKIKKHHGAEKAGEKGFTTYKRAEKGVWEKTGGDGADFLIGSKEDLAQIEEEKKKPVKKIDLSNPE